MTNGQKIAIAGGAALVVAWTLAQATSGSISPLTAAYNKLEDWGIVGDFQTSITSGRGAKYADALAQIGSQYGLPDYLLARIAYQECRFRDDIINGTVKSSAGAVGMFQLIPRWHPGVDATDWQASAVEAATYLARLYRMFGNWTQAVASYNWGEGNMKKYGIDQAPTETRNYYSQVLADVSALNGEAIA